MKQQVRAGSPFRETGPDLFLGTVLPTGIPKEALEQRVQADPFVVQDVVSAEIIEMAPAWPTTA
ncbi:hypothetical protein [Streptacidiphilus carbonis]|uniref:hypothetical protein n=1 Tax=Streptacidiphilus carbonis TaxID=105422 RepID=UPI0005AA64CC|nr:hypothetical protein [Streptacidiphilus carbonis]